jgi:hypothetical protein
MHKQIAGKGYCYFAVDVLQDNSFIGFLSRSCQTFEADFTPCAYTWMAAHAKRI